MAKQPAIEQDGTIVEALSNAMFRVELENGHIVTATYLVKCVCIILNYYQEIKLNLEMSPYDLTKARITYRY